MDPLFLKNAAECILRCAKYPAIFSNLNHIKSTQSEAKRNSAYPDRYTLDLCHLIALHRHSPCESSEIPAIYDDYYNALLRRTRRILC